MYLDSSELRLYKICALQTVGLIRTGADYGRGEYSIPKALLIDLTQVKVVSPKSSPRCVIALRYQGPEDRRASHVEDGRRFLFDTDKFYDYIFSDVYYSHYSIPAHFTTVEFFDNCKTKVKYQWSFYSKHYW